MQSVSAGRRAMKGKANLGAISCTFFVDWSQVTQRRPIHRRLHVTLGRKVFADHPRLRSRYGAKTREEKTLLAAGTDGLHAESFRLQPNRLAQTGHSAGRRNGNGSSTMRTENIRSSHEFKSGEFHRGLRDSWLTPRRPAAVNSWH